MAEGRALLLMGLASPGADRARPSSRWKRFTQLVHEVLTSDEPAHRAEAILELVARLEREKRHVGGAAGRFEAAAGADVREAIHILRGDGAAASPESTCTSRAAGSRQGRVKVAEGELQAATTRHRRSKDTSGELRRAVTGGIGPAGAEGAAGGGGRSVRHAPDLLTRPMLPPLASLRSDDAPPRLGFASAVSPKPVLGRACMVMASGTVIAGAPSARAGETA